jgi:hypothetical protein
LVFRKPLLMGLYGRFTCKSIKKSLFYKKLLPTIEYSGLFPGSAGEFMHKGQGVGDTRKSKK